MKKRNPLEDTIPGVVVGEFVEEFLTKPTYDEDGVQSTSGIRQDGREYPDPVPMSPPVGLKPPEDLMTTIRRMVHNEEFQRAANAEGFDTFEEAGDYDIDDDHEWVDELTPYESLFHPPDQRSAEPAVAPQPPPVSPAPSLNAAPPASPTSDKPT